jgi:hypothetical protein
MMRDYIDGVEKVKRIMTSKAVYVCRRCGLSHDRFHNARLCCLKVGKAENRTGGAYAQQV